MSDRWANVCSPEQTLAASVETLCVHRSDTKASAIDEFHEYLRLLIPLGTEKALTINDALGRALLLGLVSATELYFRRILAAVIVVCPLAREHASSQQISFGSVDYYGDELGLGLLEGVSFSKSGEISRQTQRVVGVEVKKDSSVGQAILEFEKICTLRHAATHSRGNLAHRNVRALGIADQNQQLALNVKLDGFQNAAGVCQNVVRSYDRFLFRRVVERWIAKRYLRADWEEDRRVFSALFQAFHSREDAERPTRAYDAYRQLRPIILNVLNEERGKAVVQGD